jgi:hypothetical protein
VEGESAITGIFPPDLRGLRFARVSSKLLQECSSLLSDRLLRDEIPGVLEAVDEGTGRRVILGEGAAGDERYSAFLPLPSLPLRGVVRGLSWSESV